MIVFFFDWFVLLQEKIYNTIEETVKIDGRILQKRIKGNELKFQIVPPKVAKTKEAPQTETL